MREKQRKVDRTSSSPPLPFSQKKFFLPSSFSFFLLRKEEYAYYSPIPLSLFLEEKEKIKERKERRSSKPSLPFLLLPFLKKKRRRKENKKFEKKKEERRRQES